MKTVHPSKFLPSLHYNSSHLPRPSQDEKKHICGFQGCNEAFLKLSELQNHMSKQHPKTYKCDQCPWEFKTPWRLKDHMRTHSDLEKLYVCEVDGCGKAYSSVRSFDWHVK